MRCCKNLRNGHDHFPLMELLAIRPGCPTTPAGSLVISSPSPKRDSDSLRDFYVHSLRVLFVLALLWLGGTTACAEGIEVRKAETHFSDGAYQLSADFNISLKFVVERALEQGVSLYFTSEFTLTHPRWYWLDEVVAQYEQTTKLSYNTLTRQYRITRGALFQNFASLDDALLIIGHQTSTPIAAGLLQGNGSYISEKLFKKDESYVAAARLRLDVTQLPKPLQVNALASDDWSLDSDWYRWVVRPDAIARNKDK